MFCGLPRALKGYEIWDNSWWSDFYSLGLLGPCRQFYKEQSALTKFATKCFCRDKWLYSKEREFFQVFSKLWKWIDFAFAPIGRFSSVEMGNSLEQYRASIGTRTKIRTKRQARDLIWVTVKYILLVVGLLQLLIVGLLALQLCLFHQPSFSFAEEACIFCPSLVRKVKNQLQILWFCGGLGGVL